MNSLKIKLALGAVAVAMLATPAFAQRPHQRVSNTQTQMQDYTGSDYQNAAPLHYPDFGADRTGSLDSQESGAQFSLGR
jgi:hypothetical protein